MINKKINKFKLKRLKKIKKKKNLTKSKKQEIFIDLDLKNNFKLLKVICSCNFVFNNYFIKKENFLNIQNNSIYINNCIKCCNFTTNKINIKKNNFSFQKNKIKNINKKKNNILNKLSKLDF